MGLLKEIVKAYTIQKGGETYSGPIEITDLKKELGTKGHVLVIRGDKALEDRLAEDELDISTPKLWLYENLINSERIQNALKQFPEHKLFDGVGFSGMSALGWHSQKIRRKPVVVFAREFVPDQEIADKYEIEVIIAEGPAEEGYVKAQAETIKTRQDIIPLHQAFYGAQALAPIGNKVAKMLEELAIKPDTTFWCIASGSSLFGIGGKIKQKFSDCQTNVVEPFINQTIDYLTNFSDPQQVKVFARNKLNQDGLDDWVKAGKVYSGVFPLHVSGPNRYLLDFWRITGKSGFDYLKQVSTKDINDLQQDLASLNPDYNWTESTALTLFPAIQQAHEGKNVVVMAYGKYRKHEFKELTIDGGPKR